MFTLQGVATKLAERVFAKQPEDQLPDACRILNDKPRSLFPITSQVYHAADKKSEFVKTAHRVLVVALSIVTVLPLLFMLGECAVSAIHAAIVKREMRLHNSQVPDALAKYKKEFVQRYISNLHKKEIKILKWTGVAAGIGCAIAGVVFSVRQLIQLKEAHKVAEATRKAAEAAAKAALEKAAKDAEEARNLAAEARSIAKSDETPENFTQLLNGKQTLSNRVLAILGGSLLGIGTFVGLTVRCTKTGAYDDIKQGFQALGRWAHPHVAKPFRRKNLLITLPTTAVLIAAYPAYVIGRQYFAK